MSKHQLSIQRFEASLFPVNAYLVETAAGVVVVDATLGVSDDRIFLRAAVEREGLYGDALADAATARMKAFLPSDDLLFLLRLSVEPTRNRLGLATREREVRS